MTRILQVVRQEFLYGGHLQCLGSVAILWTAAELFQAPFPWTMPVATYAVSYAVYAVNRIVEVQGDQLTNPERSAYIMRHLRARWWSFFLATLLAAVIAFTSAAVSGVIFLGALLVFGLLYTSTFKALTRYILALKTWYVACAFAAIVFLPFFYTGTAVPSAALPFAAWVFIDAAIMQIFLDIKDIESDEEEGLNTVPVLLGRKQAFQLVYALVFVSVLPPLFWGTLHSHFPPTVGALAVAPLLSVVPFRIAQKGRYLGYLLESAKFVTWPVLLAFGRVLLV